MGTISKLTDITKYCKGAELNDLASKLTSESLKSVSSELNLSVIQKIMDDKVKLVKSE